MASRPSWLGLLANPYQLSTLLLGLATCLLTVTTISPSSVAYLVRADYTSNNGDVASTAWFGNLGYCTADANGDASSDDYSTIQCSGAMFGYNVEEILQQDETAMVSFPEASTISIMLTRGPIVLNPIAIALCLVGMAAQQAILRRPQAMAFAISMGSSFLALVVSGIAFIFEQSLQSYIAAGRPATGTTFTTTNGPVVNAIWLALGFQLSAPGGQGDIDAKLDNDNPSL
ncbi:hypothetical protein O1611_g3009 [Lasiodiplodia mahajangana]|uniref:Uncharacterized protein n=1 Tax=Lasiodiplodia mahajangana TaxID=1108764 RepID=A0ACC2JTF4_9PEZI|nr:hypothetical protein O1611_g3009 [Lasiodiplodia mahajangana]